MTTTALGGRRARRIVAHAYPWDILGDPAFAGRALALGVRTVALAAAYHSVRAATPLHPDHQLVEAHHAALYRPVRTQAWHHRLLRPRPATWMADQDSFAAAADQLRSVGIDVDAWIVLNHNSGLGRDHPAASVTNCFGDRYPYALCPQHAEVRDYAATLAAESVRDVELSGVLLEAWGQLGVAHNSLHEKTDGAWDPATARLLSICCCPRCRHDWEDRGADPAAIVETLRRTVRNHQQRPRPRTATGAPGSVADVLGADVAEVVLSSRLHAFATSLESVLETLPETLHVSAFGSDDLWSGAPVACFTATAQHRLDTVVQGAWTPGPGPVDAVGRLRSRLPTQTSVAAYVTALPPMTAGALPSHAQMLLAAGATDLHLYHLGLAGAERLGWLGELISSVQ